MSYTADNLYGNNNATDSSERLFSRFSLTSKFESAQASGSWDYCFWNWLYSSLLKKPSDVVVKADLIKLAQGGGIYLGPDVIDKNVLRQWYLEMAQRHPKTKAHCHELGQIISDRCMAPYEHVFIEDGLSALMKHCYWNPTFVSSNGTSAIDLDGQEWIDCGCNWSAAITGNYDHLVQAASIIKEEGLQLGPFSKHVKPCCELLIEASGLDRCQFFQSGSEANEAALMSARAITGRSQVLFCVGQYHGWTMATGNVTVLRGGVADTSKSMMNRFDPNTPALIRAMKPPPAAVMYEARIYSDEDEVKCVQWFKDVTQAAHDVGAFVIQDEVVTGFRVSYKGARGKYGLDTDYVSYGKSVGCGVIIGVMMCRKQVAITLNNFGRPYDLTTETPLVDMGSKTRFPFIAVAGTYSRHTQSLIGCTIHLKNLKTKNYEKFNATVATYCEKLNTYIKSIGINWLSYHYFGGVWCGVLNPMGTPLAAVVRCAFHKNKVFVQPFGTGINSFGFQWTDDHFEKWLRACKLVMDDVKKVMLK